MERTLLDNVSVLLNVKLIDGEVWDVKLEDFQIYENSDFREPTQEELTRVVLESPTIRMRGYGDVVEHTAPNGATFTMPELLTAVEETERRTRRQSDWFGGVDAHHIYFEGIVLEKNGVWRINWGS